MGTIAKIRPSFSTVGVYHKRGFGKRAAYYDESSFCAEGIGELAGSVFFRTGYFCNL